MEAENVRMLAETEAYSGTEMMGYLLSLKRSISLQAGAWPHIGSFLLPLYVYNENPLIH